MTLRCLNRHGIVVSQPQPCVGAQDMLQERQNVTMLSWWSARINPTEGRQAAWRLLLAAFRLTLRSNRGSDTDNGQGLKASRD